MMRQAVKIAMSQTALRIGRLDTNFSSLLIVSVNGLSRLLISNVSVERFTPSCLALCKIAIMRGKRLRIRSPYISLTIKERRLTYSLVSESVHVSGYSIFRVNRHITVLQHRECLRVRATFAWNNIYEE